MKKISPEVILMQKIFYQKRIELEEQLDIDRNFDNFDKSRIKLDFKNSQYEIF